jgi:copper chaperone
MQSTTYLVPGMSCEHCRVAITGEVSKLAGVAGVDVDLAGKNVTVSGLGFDDVAVRGAIDDAGYDVA